MVSITFMVNFYYIYGWYYIYGFIKFMGDTRAAGDQFVYHEYIITDRIGRHEVLLTINNKNYNLRERKKWPSYEEKRNLDKSTDKGDVNILRPPAPRTGNKSSKAEEQARARNYNFEVLNVID